MKHKQKATIFLISSIGNLDGSVDLSEESPTTFDNLDDAIDAAKEAVKEYGMRTFVYECRPLVRIDRGKLRVPNLQARHKEA